MVKWGRGALFIHNSDSKDFSRLSDYALGPSEYFFDIATAFSKSLAIIGE
jgi:hypothetical protein